MLLECLFFDLENESNKMKKVYKGRLLPKVRLKPLLQLFNELRLDLPHPLPGKPELVSDFLQGFWLLREDSRAEHHALFFIERGREFGKLASEGR